MNCPYCGYENIEGADECDECQQPLLHLSKPQPRSPLERSIVKDRIRSLSPKPPLSVAPGTPVSEVLTLLVDNAIGCVLVTDGDDLVGIFSERDALLRLNTQAAELGDRPISDFMTPHVETLELDDRIAFALHKMDLGGYRHIPILDDGQVCGVISVRDILRYMTDTILKTEITVN
jgi:CBS domain-containing protein